VHYQRTAERIKSCSSQYILAIQDGMWLNYTSHPAKTEVGRIGRVGGKEQYGLIQHSTLCVTDKNEALGLIDVQYYHHDEFDKTIDSDHRKIADKASICWIKALRNIRQYLTNTEKKLITVADREGDFYEFLYELQEQKDSFVIRVKNNRRIGEKNSRRASKLFHLLENEKDQGEIEIILQDVNSRELRSVRLKVKWLSGVKIPPPEDAARNGEGKYQAISLNIVMAYNDDYQWMLWTDLPVVDLSSAEEILQMYKERWHIEDYHKVLKTGYQVDELYLHASRQAIENALSMAAISACRLYWIIYRGRVEKSLQADELFLEWEWKAVYVYFKETIPLEIPTASEVIIQIARLGGYKPSRHAQPPGIKTLWTGFQFFNVIAQTYKNMSSKT
jgi:hypothetical protein